MPDFDGEIKIRATLTPGDIKKTAQQLKRELSSMFDEMGGDKASAQFKKVQADIVKTIDKIESLENKLSKLEQLQIPTEEYAEIQKMIEDAEKSLQKLSNKMYDFKMGGGDITSEAYHKMQAQADEFNETISYGKGELQELVETGKAFTLGSDTQEYQQTVTQLNEANNQLTIQKARLEDVTEATEQQTKAVKRLNKEHRSASSAFEGFGKSLKRGLMMILRYGLGIRGLFALFRKLRTAVKEGLQTLGEYSEPLKQSMSDMKNSLATIKNSFAASLAPLVERFLPVVTNLANKVSGVLNTIGMYIAALSGKTTYTKAVAVQNDYADSLENTADAAKEAAGQLAGFDELTVVNTDNVAGSVGSTTNPAQQLFEEVAIPQNLLPDLSKFTFLLDDIQAKIDKIKSIGEKFWSFVKGLNLRPLQQSVANFWAVVSPIIDDLLAIADWFREKVLQPITQFLVEKGIPAVLDTLSVVIDNLWKVLKPLIDGIKLFWDENGEWIMDLVGDLFLSGLNAIKEAFTKIGEFFKKNKNIESIFKSISTIVNKLGKSKFFEWLKDFIKTAAFDSFMTSINTTLKAIEPVLSILAGVLEIISSIFTTQYKGEHQALDGLKKLASGLFDLIISPIKLIMYLIADVMDLIATLFPRRKQEMQEMAQSIRGAADEMGIFKDTASETSLTLEEISPAPINNVNEASRYAIDTLNGMNTAARDSFTKSTEWAQYCKKWGLDPVTGAVLDIQRDMNGLPVTASHVFTNVQNSGANAAKGVQNAWSTSLAGLVVAASGYGGQIAQNLLNQAQAVLNQTPVQIKATVTAQINGVNVNDKWRLALAAAGVPITGFASGGYPTPASLFWAGEGGMPEMLGTVGGRTAVAGAEEITGIREAIEAQGESQNRLLSQLINTVDNKDLSLVANATTGRWVNKSLKAYAGVTG